MEYSQKISERLWNLPDKGELESRREETYIDDIVQKSHIERTLLSSLGGVRLRRRRGVRAVLHPPCEAGL